MNKSILSVAVALAAISASAEVLTPAQALRRLDGAEMESAPALRKLAARRSVEPQRIISSTDGQPQLYLFSDADGSLMILSAESEAQPLIGYTDNYMPGAPVPPALEYMLQYYAGEIEALRAGLVTVGEGADTQTADFAPVAPLCATRWNQGAPYNADCPSDAGGKCVTGCVATAMAQVMKTYEYPLKGTGGSHSYNWNGQTLSLNYDDVTFDWDAMENTYSSKDSAPAVANLMKAVGYACDMGYGSGMSGATSIKMAQGLLRNLGYDYRMRDEQRHWYTLRDWQQMVYDELQAGYPLYYSGANPDNTAAHAFVVDGYRSDGFFHLNWGWGGLSDGYFLLSALDPAAQGTGGSTAGYDRGQEAFFNVRPNTAGTTAKDAPVIFFTYNSLNTNKTSIALNSSVTFQANNGNGAFYNGSCVATPRCQIAVKFVNAETGEVQYIRSGTELKSTAVYAGVWGKATVSMTKAKFPDGTYIASFAMYNPNTEEYYDVRYPIDVCGEVVCVVAGDTVTFETTGEGSAEVTDMNLPETAYPTVPINFSVELTNSSPRPFYGPIVVKLFESGSTTSPVASLGTLIVEVLPGETTTAECTLTVPADTEPGEYDVRITSEEDAILSESCPLTVIERPAFGKPTVSRIKVLDKAQNQLSFEITLRCTSGLYSNPMYVVLTAYGSSSIIDYFGGPTVVADASAGSVKTVVDCNFEQGVPGQRYTAYGFYVSEDNRLVQAGNTSTNFVLGEPVSALMELEFDNEGNVEFYDLNGRRISEPESGIFIRRQGSKATKVLK